LIFLDNRTILKKHQDTFAFDNHNPVCHINRTQGDAATIQDDAALQKKQQAPAENKRPASRGIAGVEKYMGGPQKELRYQVQYFP